VNPDELIEKHGADTLRLYEMFLGPLEQHKPWDTNGIEGVSRFIRKLWRLFFDEQEKFLVTEDNASEKELKVLHKTIRKVQDDIERLSLNTAVSSFMICVNELQDLDCHKKEILEPLIIALSPYAPHVTEELWEKLGHSKSIVFATYPEVDERYLEEETYEYPVSFNGKLRFRINLPTDLSNEDIESAVLQHENAQRWLEGKQPKKVIVVPQKIVNIVV